MYQGLVALLNRFMDLWFALLILVGVAAAALCCSCIGFAIYRIRHFGRASGARNSRNLHLVLARGNSEASSSEY